MFFKISESWIFNTKKIKSLGIYPEEPTDIVVEYNNGKEDRVGFKTAKDARSALYEVMDFFQIPHLPLTTDIPTEELDVASITVIEEEPAND